MINFKGMSGFHSSFFFFFFFFFHIQLERDNNGDSHFLDHYPHLLLLFFVFMSSLYLTPFYFYVPYIRPIQVQCRDLLHQRKGLFIRQASDSCGPRWFLSLLLISMKMVEVHVYLVTSTCVLRHYSVHGGTFKATW